MPFVFRSRRSCLIRRLWKRRGPEEPGERRPDDPDDKSAAYAVLKRLKEVHLEALARAVESGGAEPSDCVPVPAAESRAGRRTASPHLLCCRLWRWPELGHWHRLKRLACCRTGRDSTSVCCNPYHWSRIPPAESPPPPYGHRPFSPADQRTEDGPPGPAFFPSDGPPETDGFSWRNGRSDGASPAGPWCYLAYWEQRARVGRLYPLHGSALDVFWRVARGEGLCLSSLAHRHPAADRSVLKTREKIGLGLTLTREDDGVWIYNRSEHSLFLDSPGPEPPPAVRKLPPGHSVKVFDLRRRRPRPRPGWAQGPVDPDAVRISFAKGWGPRYSRRFVTCCPCWLEVLLAPDR